MISVLQLPRAHKSLHHSDAHSAPTTTRANLRSHSLPTPAPSPSPSLSSAASASISSSSAFSSPLSNMLSLDDSRSLSPFAPTFNPVSSRLRAMRQCAPVTPDNSCLALPAPQYDQFDAFRASKSRVVRLGNLPSSPEDPSTQEALVSLFPLFFLHPSVSAYTNGADTPTPLKMWTVRPNAINTLGGKRPVWAVFASHEEACAALSLSASAYDIDMGSISITPALEAELEPFAKLQAFDLKMLCNSVASTTTTTTTPTTTANNRSAAMMGMGMDIQSLMRYPPSPTSTNGTEAETEAELFFPDGQDEYEFASAYGVGGCGFRNAGAGTVRELQTQTFQMMQACGYTLSTNPPKARTGFRHGDWICAVPVCAAHNFGRNVTCIQCSAPRPANFAGLGLGLGFGLGGGSSGGGYVNSPLCSNGNGNGNGQLNTRSLSHAHAPGTARNASPRFANSMNSGLSHAHSHPQGQGQSQARHAQLHQQQQHPKAQSQSQMQQQQTTQTQSQAQSQAQAQAQAQAHPLLTPSGRAFAVGGKVQNVSTDPLAPCIMFWPENEALPDPGQIRPATLAAIPQPPIMNTGNKGPIEKQPGDWVCLKCDYLNWRRRKVCQTCYPYAEGNGDSVSATMHAERLAILTAVYGQSHSQMNSAHAQAAPQFKGQTQNFRGSYQASIATTVAPSQRASSVLSNNANNNNKMSSLSMLSGYPFSTSPSSHRSSEYPSGPGRCPSIPSLSVSTPVNNSRAASGPIGGMGQAAQAQAQAAAAARRAVSSPESGIGPGSIVYQTPPSPAAARPPISISSGLAALNPSPMRAGGLLPSFLKQEVQSHQQPQVFRSVSRPFGNTTGGSRTPASLSPASSTSVDLPVDEHDGSGRSVGVIGSGRSASSFYAHPRGAGSGSSMGSSSSLALAGAGASIWSIARNGDKAWSGGTGAFATVEAFKGMTL